MTDEELKILLAKISAVDNRKVDATTLLVWREILGDITYLEANAALIGLRRTMKPGEYLVPSHITGRVYRARQQYADAHPSNPGTKGLTYVAELGQYLPPQEAGRALETHHQLTNGETA